MIYYFLIGHPAYIVLFAQQLVDSNLPMAFEKYIRTLGSLHSQGHDQYVPRRLSVEVC